MDKTYVLNYLECYDVVLILDNNFSGIYEKVEFSRE